MAEGNYEWSEGLELDEISVPDRHWPYAVNEITVHLTRKFPLPPRTDTFLVKLFEIDQSRWDAFSTEAKAAIRDMVRAYCARRGAVDPSKLTRDAV